MRVKLKIILLFAAIVTPLTANNIFDAVKKNKFKLVKKIIESDKSTIHNTDENGRTPLHWAAAGGYYKIAQLLLKNKAKVDAKSNNNRTPLYLAVYYGKKKIVKLLLNSNANVNEKSYCGNSQLHWAVKKNYIKITNLLLNKNPNIYKTTELKKTPLHYAAQGGKQKIVKLLLNSNANVNIKDKNKNTPLHYATSKKNISIIKLLLENNADINAKNYQSNTPLDIAKIKNNKKIIKYLEKVHFKQNKLIKLLSTFKVKPTQQTMENIKKLLLDKKTPALIKMITITTLIQESQKKNNLISNTKKTISLYPITKAIPFIFDSGLSKKYIKKILKRAKKMNRKKFALKFINSNYIKGLLLGIKKNQLQLPPEIAEKIISFSNGDFNFQKFKPLTFNRKKYYTKNYCF